MYTGAEAFFTVRMKRSISHTWLSVGTMFKAAGQRSARIHSNLLSA